MSMVMSAVAASR